MRASTIPDDIRRMAWSVFGHLFSVARLTRRPQNLEESGRLELCGMCGRDFVNPVDWEPVGPETWWLLLRCGECETRREVTVTNAVARRYDAELKRRADVLAASLARLDRERMIGQVEAMTIALRLSLIEAADFATARNRGGQRSG
jgi:hypothetical protein